MQASIMIGSALVALGLLYAAIPAGWHEIVQRRGPFHLSDLITTGLDPAKHGWQKIAGMFAIEYTIFAGLIGSTFMTMSTHFFFSSRRRHTRCSRDWSSDVCSSD